MLRGQLSFLKHGHQRGRIHIGARQRHADALAAQLGALLPGGGKRGGARALGQVVGIGVQRAHGGGHFFVGDLQFFLCATA